MKYEKPELEIMEWKNLDVITQSQLDGEGSGGGDDYGGDGKYPWE